MTTYLDQYRAAKEDGYSDEEIMSYLEQNDPDFSSKMQAAIDDGYTPEEVLAYFNSSPNEKTSAPGPKAEDPSEKYAEDLVLQGAQGFGIGALGTYGDILDFLGLQANEMFPGEKIRREREFEILQRMEEGKRPTTGELMELSEDDEFAPIRLRLPSSQDIERVGKKAGLVTEPKTAAGRYARRIGRIGGGGVSLGATGIAAPIAAGAVGQTLEEVGAPPWAQAAGEIIAGLKASPKSKAPITSDSKEVQSVINDLRKAGYSEKDITLAKNALEERKILKKFASLTPKAENAIQQGVKNSEQLFREQIKKGLPGYTEGGLPYLEKQASNVYQTMEELASSIPVRNKEPVRKAINDSIAYLEKFPLLDEQKKFIGFMKDGLEKLDKADTADFFTGFYRNLGKAGNWGDPKQKEHMLGMIKEGIKQTFAESGGDTAKFGKYFEKTNEAWKHWLNTRDLMETIEKAQNVEGMNFKKLSSILNDPKNHELARKVLGPEQLENIKTINKGADAIESLLKQIKPQDKTSAAIKSLEAIRALLTGSFKTLAALIGIEAAKRVSTSILIDPKKQNVMKKLINAAKNNSEQQAAILAQELVEDTAFNPEEK
jgi:hypothetical protein